MIAFRSRAAAATSKTSTDTSMWIPSALSGNLPEKTRTGVFPRIGLNPGKHQLGPAGIAGPKARSKLPVFRSIVVSPLGVQYYSCASAPAGSVVFFSWSFSRCIFVSEMVHLPSTNLRFKSASNSAYFGAKRALENRNLRAGKKRKKNWNF